MKRDWFLLFFGLFFACRSIVTADTLLLKQPFHLDCPTGAGSQELLAIPLPPGSASKLLLIAHEWVKERWQVKVDGKLLGTLDQNEQPTWSVFKLPSESDTQGAREFSLVGPSRADSIDIHQVRLFDGTDGELYAEGTLTVSIADDGGRPMPGRITVIDQAGFLVPLSVKAVEENYAMRTGVVYAQGGEVRLGLAAGSYRVFVTRGPEFERAEFAVRLKRGDALKLEARLRRSVDTTGWVSCDPHTHTFTYSRHGDATVEERVLTFAGEALEFAVATDHNILTDYEPVARRMGLDHTFTAVIGDEVTTKEAHFNVFPLDADARLPDFRILDWSKLLEHFRQNPTLQIVMLNHPHNVHNGFRPFDRSHLNPVSGRVLKRLDLSVDTMEVLSSSAQQTDMMLVFRDWFALLNQGYRVVGMGSSDVHDVNRYIIGQGRTYIAADDSDVGALDVRQVCQSLKEGRALISMGLFVNMTVNDRAGVGDTVTAKDHLEVEVTVQAPSWIDIDTVELFANGYSVGKETITAEAQSVNGVGKQVSIRWDLREVRHDTYLVAMATGPGRLGPSWPIPFPYQPTGGVFTPRVAGATNPIWVDRDGDGSYSSARQLAERLWISGERNAGSIGKKLADVDAAVAVQLADLAFLAGEPLWGDASGVDWGRMNESTRIELERLRRFVE